MLDYEDITVVNEQLNVSQDADSDNRDKAREAHSFLDKRDGQWEPNIINQLKGRPRYTFDKCNPVVDGIAGEMEGADFDIRIMPSGGDATKELAKTYDGLIRNIETISNASRVYSSAGREMVASGIGGWEVVVDWVDGDSFDQDFMIREITNFEDRVWFDSASTRQDNSDAMHVFKLENLSLDEYKTKFPDGPMHSIGDDRISDTYEHKADFITVGQIIYKSPITKNLVQMSDGSVYEDTEDFQKVKDDLAEQGITVNRERKKKTFKVVSRLFDGGAFLNDPQDTVFKELPIIATYGNFKVREGKVIYRGAIENLFDAQRTYNYARSREIEDVALSPPPVTWATRKQLENSADKTAAENMSVSPQRVYIYTPDNQAPGPPLQTGGPVISPGIQQAVQNSLDDISTTSARAGLQNGQTDNVLSGVAIQSLQNKSDTVTIKYFTSQEVAICRTALVLMGALPILYDTKTQKRIINEDGSYELLEINNTVTDLDTGETVKLHDLSKGKYDVTCDVGPAFKNRQQEAVKALNDLGQLIPGLPELTADIQLKNISAPGVDIAAERVRQRLVNSGVIPESQLTDIEKQEIQVAQQAAAQQPQEATPESKIADAEIARVQAETQDVAVKAQLRQEELRIREQDSLMKAQHANEKLQMEELALNMKHQSDQLKAQSAVIQASIDGQAQVFDILNTQANTLKVLREAMGVDTIVGPNATEAFINQTETITEQQEDIDNSL